jgi:hypothetical protein
VWCSMKSGSNDEYSSGHMCPLKGETLPSKPPPMMPCIQPWGSSNVLEKLANVLERKTTPIWATMFPDWALKASANFHCSEFPHGSSLSGHRIVSLM